MQHKRRAAGEQDALRRSACAIVCILMLLTQSGVGIAKGDATLKHVEAAISAVDSARSVDLQRAAAERLARLTRKPEAKSLSQRTIHAMTALLDYRDDTVQYWVATAIGNIGPAARDAIPKLEKMLPKAECVNGTITSASGIRYALRQLGVKHILTRKCARLSG